MQKRLIRLMMVIIRLRLKYLPTLVILCDLYDNLLRFAMVKLSNLNVILKPFSIETLPI